MDVNSKDSTSAKKFNEYGVYVTLGNKLAKKESGFIVTFGLDKGVSKTTTANYTGANIGVGFETRTSTHGIIQYGIRAHQNKWDVAGSNSLFDSIVSGYIRINAYI